MERRLNVLRRQSAREAHQLLRREAAGGVARPPNGAAVPAENAAGAPAAAVHDLMPDVPVVSVFWYEFAF